MIDRGEAISTAINEMGAYSVILITGKGNETRQKRGIEYIDCPTDVEYTIKSLKEYDKKNGLDNDEKIKSVQDILPQLHKLHNKKVVIKLGGSCLDDETLMKNLLEDKDQLNQTNIPLVSWKKFNRIMDKVLCDEVFTDDVSEDSHEIILSDSLREIKPNQVRVIDIAHLDEKSQGFVFGDVMDTLHTMMSAKNIEGMPDKIIVFVDELNKYASKDTPKSSQILQQLLEITERGRSLGLILFSVEQFKSAIHERVRGNCATGFRIFG